MYVNGTEPLFIFGDFNFRLEFSDVVKVLYYMCRHTITYHIIYGITYAGI